MGHPITTELPHQLGREEARRRIEGGIDKVADFVPGGSVTDHRWEGDTMVFTIAAMGQTLGCRLDVHDDKVVANFDLPMFLAPFAEKIREKLRSKGPKLLEKK